MHRKKNLGCVGGWGAPYTVEKEPIQTQDFNLQGEVTNSSFWLAQAMWFTFIFHARHVYCVCGGIFLSLSINFQYRLLKIEDTNNKISR